MHGDGFGQHGSTWKVVMFQSEVVRSYHVSGGTAYLFACSL